MIQKSTKPLKNPQLEKANEEIRSLKIHIDTLRDNGCSLQKRLTDEKNHSEAMEKAFDLIRSEESRQVSNLMSIIKWVVTPESSEKDGLPGF